MNIIKRCNFIVTIPIRDFSHKYVLSLFNLIWNVSMLLIVYSVYEHELVENLLCVSLALLNFYIKAVFQERKPESLGITKSHTER